MYVAYMRILANVCSACLRACAGPKEDLRSPGAGVAAVVSLLMWVLGTACEFSSRATSMLNCGAIAPRRFSRPSSVSSQARSLPRGT